MFMGRAFPFFNFFISTSNVFTCFLFPMILYVAGTTNPFPNFLLPKTSADISLFFYDGPEGSFYCAREMVVPDNFSLCTRIFSGAREIFSVREIFPCACEIFSVREMFFCSREIFSLYFFNLVKIQTTQSQCRQPAGG